MSQATTRRHPSKRGTVEERFWRYVEKTDGCWNWTGMMNATGYGRLSIRVGFTALAHRVSLAIHEGLDLEGWKYGDLVVDHICRNRRCVNPGHLREVTQRINVLENSDALAAGYVRRDMCNHGHPLDRTQTWRGRTWRVCRTCASHYQAVSRQKRRERVAA